MAATVAIVKCECKNDFQDKRYGNQMRVANKTQKGDGTKTDARCTVCSKIHRVLNGRFK